MKAGATIARLLFLLAFCASARAGDWRSEITQAPGSFPAFPPLKAHYKFGWTMFSAAEADFQITRKKETSRLAMSTRSIGAVRSMWRMNAEHVSIIDTSTFLPISMSQTEVYKDETSKIRVDFTPTGLSRLHETIPVEKDSGKTKRFEFPNVFDLQGALQFIRSQKLKAGDVYKVVVYPAKSPYLAEADVDGPQKLKVAGRTYSAIKLHLKLQRIADDGLTLQTHDKFKSASVWVSDDSIRLLLKIEAEIAVGSVWAELDSVDLKPK